MDYVLQDVRDFLCFHHPWGESAPLGKPSLVIVGGSQAVDGGIHKLHDSDTDVLVLYDQIRHPTSFQFSALGRNNAHYDLIVRDKATFAYDVQQALQNGKGTLIHIAAHGTIIHDACGIGSVFQERLVETYRQGPLTVHRDDVNNELSDLMTNFHYLKHDESYDACVSALCNRIGRLALRFSGHWTSNGKIGGRFLEKEMPDFAESICTAFADAVGENNKKPLETLALQTLRETFEGADPIKQIGVAEAQVKYPFTPIPKDLAEATTAARCDIDSFAHYLRGTAGNDAKQAAVTWAQIKLSTLFTPLSAERFQRKPMEYFMALGRAIGGAADIFMALDGHRKPSELCAVERIQYLFDHESAAESLTRLHVSTAFTLALAGEPSALQTLKNTMIDQLYAISPPRIDRPSPATHRIDPTLFGL